MEALDLRKAPPRRPRAELAGILFLPRSIDKIRATLPGGHLGVYTITGFTEMMFEKFGIPLSEVTEVVRTAASDDEVGTYIAQRAQPGSIEAWHELVLARLPRNGDRTAAVAAYPFLANRPDLVLSLDVLEEDDRQMFAV